jgi:DNA-binding response OmpR family regulator
MSLLVLLLEADAQLREKILAPSLRRIGFEIVAVGTEIEMIAALSERHPDIMLLDVERSNCNAFELVRTLRLQCPGLGIVFLTGHLRNSDLVRGLTEGADAYLSKPVEIDVIAATLYSVARRLVPASKTERGVWHLSSDAWFLVSPTNTKVQLSKAEKKLLEILMQHPNEVFLRDDLIGAMTDNVLEFDPHRLDSILHRLRRKVITIIGEPLPVNAVHGIGYKLTV